MIVLLRIVTIMSISLVTLPLYGQLFLSIYNNGMWRSGALPATDYFNVCTSWKMHISAAHPDFT